jgi:hypothetical protein
MLQEHSLPREHCGTNTAGSSTVPAADKLQKHRTSGSTSFKRAHSHPPKMLSRICKPADSVSSRTCCSFYQVYAVLAVTFSAQTHVSITLHAKHSMSIHVLSRWHTVHRNLYRQHLPAELAVWLTLTGITTVSVGDNLYDAACSGLPCSRIRRWPSVRHRRRPLLPHAHQRYGTSSTTLTCVQYALKQPHLARTPRLLLSAVLWQLSFLSNLSAGLQLMFFFSSHSNDVGLRCRQEFPWLCLTAQSQPLC